MRLPICGPGFVSDDIGMRTMPDAPRNDDGDSLAIKPYNPAHYRPDPSSTIPKCSLRRDDALD